MRELVLELMGEYGNLAVFLLILVENLFPPIPSEVILTFGGVMTTCTDMTPGGVILFSTAGSMAGAVILYGAGRFLPDEIFRKLLCGKAGQLLHFRPEDVDLAKDWFRDRGKSAVFLCRLVPEPDLYSRRDRQDAGRPVSCFHGGGEFSVEYGSRLCRQDRRRFLGEGVSCVRGVLRSLSDGGGNLRHICSIVPGMRGEKKKWITPGI